MAQRHEEREKNIIGPIFTQISRASKPNAEGQETIFADGRKDRKSGRTPADFCYLTGLGPLLLSSLGGDVCIICDRRSCFAMDRDSSHTIGSEGRAQMISAWAPNRVNSSQWLTKENISNTPPRWINSSGGPFSAKSQHPAYKKINGVRIFRLGIKSQGLT